MSDPAAEPPAETVTPASVTPPAQPRLPPRPPGSSAPMSPSTSPSMSPSTSPSTSPSLHDDIEPPHTGSGAGIAAIVLTLLFAAAAAAGLYYVWSTPNRHVAARLAAVEATVASLDQRVAKLEQAPPPAVPAPAPTPTAAPPTPTSAKTGARPPAAPPPPAPPPAASNADLSLIATRLDQVAARQDALAARQQSESAASTLETARLVDQQKAAIAALTDRVAKAEQAQTALSGLASRTQRLARLQEASASLRLGQPLGTIDGAPPALARYATVSPPSEAGLRIAFPPLAAQAAQAARPPTGGRGFWRRAWIRIQDVITIREADHVIVGNPVAGLLAHAQTYLDAGDLAGAVSALSQLPPEAAAPLDGWMTQARDLLAARAALTAVEAQG